MSVSQFNGKIVLSGTGLVDTSVVPNSKTTWNGTFSFSDNTGKYLGTDVIVGDMLVFDTSASEIGTITSYAITSISAQAFNSVTATFSYLSSNANPAGPPDLTEAVGQLGVIVRRSSSKQLASVPSPGIQMLPDVFTIHLSNDNAFKILDVPVQSPVYNDITTNSMLFDGTGPVELVSGSDLNLIAPGIITFGAPAQLLNKTKAQLLTMLSAPPGVMAFCTDTVSGPVSVYFDGTAWRKIFDNGVI